MTNPINVTTKDLGVIDGLQTFEVIDAGTGETIGYNQSVPTTEEVING